MSEETHFLLILPLLVTVRYFIKNIFASKCHGALRDLEGWKRGAACVARGPNCDVCFSFCL